METLILTKVGEAFLSSLFEAIFNKLGSEAWLSFARQKNVAAEIKKWEEKLKIIKAVLQDAEEKQLTSQPVKYWLEDLQDLAYDVDDILDEFSYELLHREVKAKNQTSTVRKNIPTFCTGFTPKALLFNCKMASKLEEITTRLQKIIDEKDLLNLSAKVGSGTSRTTARSSPSGCLPVETKMYGREEEKRRIVDLLLKSEPSDEKIGVIPIVGMGGSGKTTLAQFVYHHKEVADYFQVRAWVCVSSDYDILRITKGIIEAVTNQSCDLTNINSIQLRLHGLLQEKKFLLVIDDLWNEKYDDWLQLRTPFMDGAPGSKIIVTTRSASVARMMSTVELQTLGDLLADDCWSLFKRHAFGNRDPNPKLETIGRQMLKKCSGLPLALRTLGGMLRTKDTVEEWEAVSNSELWKSKDDISAVLKLSYYDLPSHLKRCFAYCAILPEDYVFEEEELVLLWMAEGLIQMEQEGEDEKHREELGNDYFRDLVSRSMFQPSSQGEAYFVMHDLMHDLAQEVAGKTCYRLKDDITPTNQAISARARHSSFIRGDYDGIKKFEPLQNMQFLRTFLSFNTSYNYLSNVVASDLLPKLRRLRVLSLKEYQIYELPECIGTLKHLRYLDLSSTYIKRLPQSITTLYNLETLFLKGCRNLRKLPSDIGNLINLSHLDISWVPLDEGLPVGIDKLTNLQRLSDFVIGKDNGCCVNALKNLKFRKGTLCISGLENITSAEDARSAGLIDKKLKVVSLGWSFQPHNAELAVDVLKELQPHKDLQELSIVNYGGISFPSWMGDISLPNLVELRLTDCKNCTSLPRLGSLPSLKDLSIHGMSAIKTIGRELYGEDCSNPFANLETLSLRDMEEWEDWTTCEVELPRLSELYVERCPRLSATLPKHLPSLKKLVIVDCPFLAVFIPKLPALFELQISNCKEADCGHEVYFDSLNSLSLSKIPVVTSAFKGKVMQAIKLVKELVLMEGEVGAFFRSQRFPRCELDVSPQFTFLMVDEKEEQTQQGFAHSNVGALQLSAFQRLEKLPEWICNVKSLTHLRITDCPKLVSFSEAPTLKRLHIENCSALQILLENGTTSTIEDLTIEGCPSVTTLSARGDLPSTLKNLWIEECSELASISSGGKLPVGLEGLHISKCPKLKSLTTLPARGDLPSTLKNLKIWDCSELASISSGGKLPAGLKVLSIHNCPRLESIAERFDDDMKSFQVISIYNCSNLDNFPDGLSNLTSLETLHLVGCPGINSFLGEGFPTNLTVLSISDLNIINPAFEWGLHRLAHLQSLAIKRCPGAVSFPSEEIGMRLPGSLIELTIEDFPDLKNLSTRGFQDLGCLQFLSVQKCPKLTSFPKDGLPPCLLGLPIIGCPLLEQSCHKGNKQQWSHISHIPRVEIGGKSVFDPEYWPRPRPQQSRCIPCIGTQ